MAAEEIARKFLSTIFSYKPVLDVVGVISLSDE
jgi:hypothetical protein